MQMNQVRKMRLKRLGYLMRNPKGDSRRREGGERPKWGKDILEKKEDLTSFGKRAQWHIFAIRGSPYWPGRI